MYDLVYSGYIIVT